jgi:hypothetical protein
MRSSVMRFTPTFFLSALVLMVGCKPAAKISEYEVKSEPVAAPAAPVATAPAVTAPVANNAPGAMQATESMKADAARAGSPKWAALPAGWTVGPENAMRKATWIITDAQGAKAEIAVTVFPGSVGGITANVNRWRNQIGLSPADEATITASAKDAKVGTDAGQRFVMTNPDTKKSTDAFLIPKNGSTWFLKLSGDAAVVQSQAETFAKFLADSQLP